MMNWQLAIAILLALLVGMLLPVLLQVRSTVRSLEEHLSSRRLEETLCDLRVAARGFRVAGQQLELGEPRIADVMQAVHELGHAARKVRESVKVTAALGTAAGAAITAAVRALRKTDGETPVEGSTEATAKGGAFQGGVATVARPGAGETTVQKRRAP